MFKLNLHLFADVINVTTSASEGNNLSPEMKTFYDRQLIDLAEAKLVHDQFGQKRPIPQGTGKTIEFRQFSPLPKITRPLSEGVTPDGQALDVSAKTATVTQLGGFVRLSDMLDMTAFDNVAAEALKLIGSQAGRSIDTLVREILNGGTNVQYAEGQVDDRTKITKSHLLTVKAIRMAVRSLKRQNAETINGSYVAIIHPDVAYDLMSDPEWKDWHQYTTPENMYRNEIGQIAGVRFVESTEAKIFEKAGSGSVDVYSTLILADNAYGVTDLEGGGLKTIVKQLGSGGTADPLEQRSTVGWKCTRTAKILVEQYMVRIETGCSV